MRKVSEMINNTTLLVNAGFRISDTRIYDTTNGSELKGREASFDLTIFEGKNGRKIVFQPINGRTTIDINNSLRIVNIEHKNDMEIIASIKLGSIDITQICIKSYQSNDSNDIYVYFKKYIPTFDRDMKFEEYGDALQFSNVKNSKRIVKNVINNEECYEDEEIEETNIDEIYNTIVNHILNNEDLKDNENTLKAIEIMKQTIYMYIDFMLTRAKIRRKKKDD